MAAEHTRTFVRDDRETEIDVTWVMESYGSPPSWWDLGDGAELYIDKAVLFVAEPSDPEERRKWLNEEPPYDDASLLVELTDAERDRIETEIHENPEWWEPDDGPDPDDWRDRRIDDRLTGGDA